MPRSDEASATTLSEASKQRESDAAAVARQALVDLLTSNENRFTISDPVFGKYAGRILADVPVNRRDVATQLIEQGHAQPYDGGTKPAWK